jgi:hypothetical protein
MKSIVSGLRNKNIINFSKIFKLIFLIWLIQDQHKFSTQCSDLKITKTNFDINLFNDNSYKEGFILKNFHADGPISLSPPPLASTEYSFRENAENEAMKKYAEIENYSPKIRRKTQDGRLCAKAFVSNQKTFFDCTKTRTPDGDITESEWCYVDPMYTDDRKWGYCEAILDYDRVRAANFGTMKELTKMISSLSTDMEQGIYPTQRAMEEIKGIRQKQIQMSMNLNEVTKSMDKLFENLQKLSKVSQEYSDQEKKVKELMYQIEVKEKELKAKEQLEQKDFSYALKTNNCKGMLLYEHEEDGDGLIGYYYDNENWLGDFKVLKSKELYFDWTNGEPLKGINPHNFSIRWEGWIRIPITDYYIFSIECDDGAEVLLNDEIIISHHTNSLIQSFKESEQSPANPTETTYVKKINPYKSSSKEIFLVGNTKFKFTIRYFHSIHTSVFTDGQVYFKLFWQSRDFQETIIQSDYLYSSFDFNPLKIYDYDPEEMILRRLRDNDQAFINSDRYILQDVPSEFINFHILKMKTRYTKDSIVLKTNEPTSVYIALLAHYPNPLPSTFENTGKSMSLLEIDKNQSKGSKRLVAKKSGKLIIYKRSYNKGNIQINLNKFGINSKGIPMITFFGFDSTAKKPLICSGKEEIISLSTGRNFKSCQASSDLPGFKCEDAFSGKMRDEEGGMWAANSDGVGAWISIKFKKIFKITRVDYRNRKNSTERNSKIEALFSSSEKQTFFLKNDDEIISYKVNSVRADEIKFTIRGVYAMNNNGGSFNIYGMNCYRELDEETEDEIESQLEKSNKSQHHISEEKKNSSTGEDSNNIEEIQSPLEPSQVQPLFTRDAKKPIILTCYDSITNSSKFDRITLTTNKKIIVKCPESCSMSEIPVYGTFLYAKDSGICKAAFHSGKMSAIGGLVVLNIKPGTSNYKGSQRGGIKSEGKTKSKTSISFETYEEEDNILLKPGTKVDLKLDNSNSRVKWVPAIITKVHDTNNGKFVNLILDGENSNAIELPYPNKNKIQACGEHVKNRDCKGSLRKLKKKLPILIRFVPKNYQSNLTDKGFLSDNGQVFGANSKSFGWSVNMSSKILERSNTSHPYLETLVLFPPPPNSRFCNRSRPEQMCEPVIWRVKAGRGRFIVKLYVGDSSEDRIINLKINGKYFAMNKLIPKNSLKVLQDILETKNQLFELTSDCIQDCDHSISIISAIELIPYEGRDSEDLNSSDVQEKLTNCGNAYTGGRCNKGPDVLHCLFDDPTFASAKFCNGEQSLISIPNTFKCAELHGLYKCVNKVYADQSECKLNCPQDCQDSKCIY